MPEVVERYHRENPEVKLVFINCTDRQLREELNSGRLDLAFLMTDLIHFKEVNVRMLRTEKLVLISGYTHSLAGRKRVALGDLKGETLLLPKTD